jgi:pimeloyl-ACP methyl ester carboxylesterase
MPDKQQNKRRTAAAGLPSADWSPRDVPAGTTTRNVVLRTRDGAPTTGSLYTPQRADTVVCIMHPREFMACHYLVPDIVGAGYAAWTQSPRAIGNDLRLEHEIALYEVAAGMAFLRSAGFRNIVLLGNSGGAGLYSLYVQQASTPASERIEKTPSGRATQLSELEMPVVDGMIFIAPHPGQGALLLQCIDPSVMDETDPLAVDSALDPLHPGNGFAEPPESSGYTQEFVSRYRAAQLERVKRLDQRARDLIEERLAVRRRGNDIPAVQSQPADRRKSAHTPIMTVWRTDADLRCFDLSLDPSDRRYGSLWGADPYASNYGCVGFGRICTPESWLSTWSGVSSNARVAKTARAISQPSLLIEYTGDQACFPSVVKEIFESIGSVDKRHERVRGDHHGRALTADEEPGRLAAGRLMQAWLHEKFPL